MGLVEGGCCNDENVHAPAAVPHAPRRPDRLGDCATMAASGACDVSRSGSVWTRRSSRADGINPTGAISIDPDFPLLLNKVDPVQEVVKIDYDLPGRPPSADTIGGR